MNIYVWGTGRLTGEVVGKRIDTEEILGFVDNDSSKKEYMGKPVFSPKDISGMDYDAILVANVFTKEIYEQSSALGLDVTKIIFLFDNCVLEDFNRDYGFVESVLGKAWSDEIKNRQHVIKGPETFGEINFSKGPLKDAMEEDYVRIKTFELVVREIYKRNVSGGVAEVGVFRGEFARFINYAFPDRKCYLFDTFEGFNEEEGQRELERGNCTRAFLEAYSQTSVEMVMNNMPYKDNVVIKKGYFPESLEGLEENFAFVSIDVDFEESIYESLKYFYPRLMQFGYIFIHDYNSDLRGVEKAIERYERDNDIRLNSVPLCDRCGTLVISK